ncbi:MAG: hypothetical protein IT368_13760, partial [Candidatus Hydrogenedentes bacterium]|nr:hypothetical protein [Candidatus Hydrogenedentota bacterium]
MNRIQSFLDGYGPHMGAVLVLSIVAAAYAQDGPNLRFEAAQAETSATCATGAVGLDYIVSVWQPGDSDSPALDVFSKSGVLLQRVPLSSLFEDSTAFGPAVLFDTHRQRFVLAAHGYRSSLAGVSTLALAVSRTANPLEGWHSFAITHPGHLTGIKLGFNRHWYAITAYDAYAPLAPGRPHLYVFDSGAAANGAVKVTAFDLTRELGVLEYFDPFAAPAATYDASDRLYIAGTHTNDTGSGSTGLLRMARIEGTVADPVFVSAPLFPTGPAWARLASAFPNTVPNAPQPQGVTAVEAIQGPAGAWTDSVSTASYRTGSLW